MNRIDIKQHDVFISWTGSDRALKDRIVAYLRAHGVTCLESDHQCSGDFRQWSREAVKECNIFLLVCSEATFQSTYVPVEIEEYKKLPDYTNRIVPVCTSPDVFSREPWGISEYASAAIMGGDGLTEDVLELIWHKVNSLNINLLDRVYARAANEEHIKLIPLAGTKKLPDREFGFSELYVERFICEVGKGDSAAECIKDPKVLCKSEDIIFISGPAGCGKSRYTQRIRQSADEDTITVVLSCCKFSESAQDVFAAMFGEFRRICGNRYFYSEEDFKSLINNRHLLLVLDGMDEISTVERRRKLISKVEEYYRANKNSTTLLFTGRNESDADLLVVDGKKARHFRLEKLDDENIRTLSEKLFLLFGNEDKNNEFYVRIKDLNDEIKANPLLLSQLAIIYNNSGEIPATVVGIYDAISEITLRFDKNIDIDVPESYRDMVETKISAILKAFSLERYSLLSRGKVVETGKILRHILKGKYGDEAEERADFLVDYLQSRAILVDGDFYHKMFLEYFTAVKYYENAFDDFDEIETPEAIGELFSHYSDPYWSEVIKMFLVKADSCIDRGTTNELYSLILTYGIHEYTVLFDTCRDLIRHKEEAQLVLVSDILKKSAEGIYPPYGPLFWYVSEYDLYEIALLALENLKESDGFDKMLALVRDVCYISGGKNTAEAVSTRVNAAGLYRAATLCGVRNALCQLFYLGATDFAGGNDIYPRCFNVAEAKAFAEQGCGIMGVMSTPFEDELGLFSHESLGVLGDEYIGLVSCRYDIAEAEKLLSVKSCRKVCGLILAPGENTVMEYISFNRNHISVVYIPENIESVAETWNEGLELSLYVACTEGKKLYFKDKAVLSGGIEKISENMFYKCEGLKAVHIPEGVKEIGDKAFCGCTSLETVDIPEGVEKICYGAFAECHTLKRVTVPSTVTEIGESAFHFCFGLTELELSEGLKIIGRGAFLYCSALESVDIPDSVVKISPWAFKECKSLKEVVIPERITTIFAGTFEECEALTLVQLPENLQAIGGHAFSLCVSLEGIDIPETVTSIGFAAFFHCSSLKEINIPENVTVIPERAFCGCVSLTEAYIPLTVEEIEGGAFRRCDELKRVEVPGDANISPEAFDPHTEVVKCGDVYEFLPVDVVIVDDIEIIPKDEFFGDRNVRSVVIPESVTEIEAEAFANCINLVAVDIPDTVTTIGERTFFGCTALEGIKLSSRMTEIEYAAFFGCTSLAEVEIPMGIKVIGTGAFSDCVALKSVSLPDSLTNIYQAAFMGCTSLERINIPSGVTVIDVETFKECTALAEINIPIGVRKIDYAAFENCCSLTSVDLPEGLTEIEAVSFKGCRSIVSVHIPESVVNIGKEAFWCCEALESVRLPEGITQIERETFFRCFKLEKVNIPRGVKEIGIWAFFACKSLTEIEIPDSVETIGHGAFLHCEKLESVVIPESVRIMGDSVFSDCTALRHVKISRKFEDDIERIFGNIDPNIVEFWN